MTGKDGTYLFDGLAPGTYAVSAAAKIKGFDFTSDSDGNVDWRVNVSVPSEGTGLAEFAGLGKGELLGQMFETGTGRGLALATITCRWGGYDDQLGNADDVPFEVTADAQGQFDMAGVPYGNFSCSGLDNSGRRSENVTAAVFSAEAVRAPLPVRLLATTGGEERRSIVVGLGSILLGALLLLAGRRRRRASELAG